MLHLEGKPAQALDNDQTEAERPLLPVPGVETYSELASSRKWLQPLALLNVLVFLLSISTLLIVWGLRQNNGVLEVARVQNALLKETSFYSPVLDEIDIPLKTVQIEGSFFDSDPPSIYRQKPSPEVDAAWAKLTAVGQVFLSTEEVIRLGKDPELTVRNNEKPEEHIGIINVFHEIHCLDMLRRNLHPEYYWPNGTDSPMHWIHVYHCIHILLQALTCSASVDIVTYNWMETQQNPVFDFSVNRVCRDFEKLRVWQGQTMSLIEEMKFTRQGGEKEIPAPEQLKEINALETRP